MGEYIRMNHSYIRFGGADWTIVWLRIDKISDIYFLVGEQKLTFMGPPPWS
jgi:hypothetical protein